MKSRRGRPFRFGEMPGGNIGPTLEDARELFAQLRAGWLRPYRRGSVNLISPTGRQNVIADDYAAVRRAAADEGLERARAEVRRRADARRAAAAARDAARARLDFENLERDRRRAAIRTAVSIELTTARRAERALIRDLFRHAYCRGDVGAACYWMGLEPYRR